jgi:uncharacterized protein YdeI (YjbR/CyaY-like superfamily)
VNPSDITFFGSPAEFRAWLQANHETAAEKWVGFHRRATGRPSMTWPESVDEALCFGWIDGLRKGLDAERYTIRFTPRRRTSNWSAVNLRRVPELVALGRMQPAGLRAHEERDRRKDAIYSYENRPRDLAPEYQAELAANPEASAWFDAQPAGFRRTATYWIMSAKQEATQRRRLAQLIGDAAAGRRPTALIPPGGGRGKRGERGPGSG